MDNNQGTKRLAKVATEFNVGVQTIIEFLNKNGFPVDNPNAKIGQDAYSALLKEFHLDKTEKQVSENIRISTKNEVVPEEISNDVEEEKPIKETPKKEPVSKTSMDIDADKTIKEEIDSVQIKTPKVVGKIDIEEIEQKSKKKTAEKKTKKEVEKKVVKETKKPKQEKAEKKVETEEQKPVPEEHIIPVDKLPGPKLVGKIDINPENKTKEKKEEISEKQEPKEIEKSAIENVVVPEAEIQKEEIDVAKKEISSEPEKEKIIKEKQEETDSLNDDKYHKTEYITLTGPKVIDSIDLSKVYKKPSPKEEPKIEKNKQNKAEKKPRPRLPKKESVIPTTNEGKQPERNKKQKQKKVEPRPVISEEDIQKHIRETLSQLQGTPKSKSSKYRRMKRDAFQQQRVEEMEEMEKEQSILKVNEFITVSELANMMNVPATKVIEICMGMGLFVSLNQRLDAEAITIVASEFGFDVSFISIEEDQQVQEEEEDSPENLVPRAPVVTVMGHVDHGKTSLLDNIRKSNVIAGESGGITQHIGAYEVTLESGRKIAFLDTPGHEAFTAMRARGAKITDVAIIVIAADDQVMPQTVEAINHARAAGVPMIFAISKIDKQGANPEKIKEQLANMNLLVEDWGGKYQSQEINAKQGVNVDVLLEKVLLESDLLDLKANPNKLACGTVIESSLDKGRGYTATILVHSGTLRVGDIILAGSYYGRVKAMFNERNQPVKEAGPSTPVLILGLNGAPAAGDRLTCHKDEKTAKDIATKRQQLIREQSLRTQKHITLDEIGRRIAIGDFKELNIIVKGDVDGSVEALADSLLKLSASSVQVNVIHKAIGGITESDVLLATASNAIIIGFQVRPSVAARKLAETEEIDIRTYSVIYDAIEEVKAAMEGMLEPKIEEKVVASVEVREVFKISKVGTIAGCMVLDGKISRSSKIHLIRNGIVIFTGVLSSLKRFKDDVKEVVSGQDCGIAINNFNDLKEGDIIEAYTEIEIQRKL